MDAGTGQCDTKIGYSLEKLSHFLCGRCSGWWSIGDWQVRAKGRTNLYCPWCGVKQEVATMTPERA